MVIIISCDKGNAKQLSSVLNQSIRVNWFRMVRYRNLSFGGQNTGEQRVNDERILSFGMFMWDNWRRNSMQCLRQKTSMKRIS